MIDLSRIPDDKTWGVICENEDDLVEFVEAIKTQRKDVDIGSFRNKTKLSESFYHGKAYFLNYSNSHRLQHGEPRSLPGGLITMTIHQLRVCVDLPEIQADQVESLSLFGF